MTWGVVVGEEALGRACVQGEVQGDLVVDKWINGRRRGAGDHLLSTVFMTGPGYVIPIPGSRS